MPNISIWFNPYLRKYLIPAITDWYQILISYDTLPSAIIFCIQPIFSYKKFKQTYIVIATDTRITIKIIFKTTHKTKEEKKICTLKISQNTCRSAIATRGYTVHFITLHILDTTFNQLVSNCNNIWCFNTICYFI